MDQKKFGATLPIFVAAIVDKIQKHYNISEDEAIEKFVTSKIYSFLEREETKVWQYSTDKLLDLYLTEMETGKLDFPEC